VGVSGAARRAHDQLEIASAMGLAAHMHDESLRGAWALWEQSGQLRDDGVYAIITLCRTTDPMIQTRRLDTWALTCAESGPIDQILI
jgi:hypothetical protein